MDRRRFITLSGIAAGGAASLASPALSQTGGRTEWRAASGFSSATPILRGALATLAGNVEAASEGRFRILFDEEAAPAAPGEALSALRGGGLDLLHTAPTYFSDTDPSFAFGSVLPFGLNQRLTDAWLVSGGLDLFNEFLAGFDLVGLPAGNTGAQTGGWFNREINSADDLGGLRYRIGGFGARIMAGIDMLPVEMAPERIAGALQADEIDGAEFAAPADDIRLGLNRAARYLYYPGWWAGGSTLMALMNRGSFNALSEADRAILRQAAAATHVDVIARYDAANAEALAELIAADTIIRPYTNDVMEAAFAASESIYEDLAAGNAAFGALLKPYMDFRRSGFGWARRSEYAYSAFLVMAERSGRL